MPGALAGPGLLKEKLAHLHGGRVLDVACGAGGFINVLAEGLLDYEHITGIDASERVLAMAKDGIRFPYVTLETMDAMNLGFDEASFDTVAISNSLHHMPEPGTVLSGMMRVLRPGGLFIVREMYRDGQSEPQMTHVLFHLLRAELDTLKGETHRRSYLRREIVAAVEGLELDGLEMFDIGPGDADPKDEETCSHMLKLIDTVIAHPGDYGYDQAFKVRAGELKDRVREVGFLPSSSLVAIGRKPA